MLLNSVLLKKMLLKIDSNVLLMPDFMDLIKKQTEYQKAFDFDRGSRYREEKENIRVLIYTNDWYIIRKNKEREPKKN